MSGNQKKKSARNYHTKGYESFIIVASGGLVFSKDKDVIYPGCCCG